MHFARDIILGPEFAALEDDTAALLLGGSLHQAAITALDDGLNACGRERGLRWFVGNQIEVLIARQGQRLLRLAPDILVHPTLSSGSRDYLYVAADGPPALVIEVVCHPTVRERNLRDTPDTKPATYAALGTLEYIAFDPLGGFETGHVWARRRGPDGFESWPPEADERWHSRALGISFAPLGIHLRIYDQDGQLVPLGWESRAENRRLRALADEAAAREAERERQIAALQAQLRALRGE